MRVPSVWDDWADVECQSLTGEYCCKSLKANPRRTVETAHLYFVNTRWHKTQMAAQAELRRNKEIWEAQNPSL